MINLKQLLANKNVVTVIGAVLIVLVLYGFYNWRLQQATSPIRVPYANQTISSRTKITEDMISYVEIPQTSLKGNILTNANTQILGYYTNVTTVIPSGSFFYADVIVTESQLPDSFLINIPDKMVAYSYGVSVESTYGNSMYPGNYVDMYFKGIEGDKVLLGKMIENVKILAVKDSSGNHVFEGVAEQRQPSQIIFAVDYDMHSLLRKAEYIEGVELILVPTSVSYTAPEEDAIVTSITSEYITSYINNRSMDADD